MQVTSPEGRTHRAEKPTAPPLPLSVIHAEALYRPRPPVGYDDEGYPFEDSKVAESTKHDNVLGHFRMAAFTLVVDQPDTMVQRNLLILFEQGNPRAAVEPDVTVSLGVGRRDRNSYKLWVEGKPPDLVIEGLSETTWHRDVEVKPALYRDLGVREFWQLDPIGWTPNPISGYRLSGGVYRPITPSPSGAYRSAVLNAELSYDREEMHIVNLRTGRRLAPHHETERQRDEAEHARDEEAHARREAEHARDEEAHSRREAEHARDEEARARREEVRRRLSEGRAYEARIAELEARLRSQRRGDAHR